MIFWINLPLGLAGAVADRPRAAEAAAERAAAPARHARRRADGRCRAVADAGRELGRHPLRLGLGADPRTAGRQSRVVGAVRAPRRDSAGALHSGCDPARADCSGGRHRRLLQRRRDDRPVDLPAALFPAGAGIYAVGFRHRADRVSGGRHGGLVHRRPADGAHSALQARAARRARARARDGRGVGGEARGPVASGGVRAADGRRSRTWRDVSGDDDHHPEHRRVRIGWGLRPAC